MKGAGPGLFTVASNDRTRPRPTSTNTKDKNGIQMTRDTHISATARGLRAARLRLAFARMARRLGRYRGHVIRRVTNAAGRLAQPSKLRTNALGPFLINMPSVTSELSGMGLGLAGGGGGSPGTFGF